MAIVKVIELVGSSPNSFEEAVKNAVETAAKTVRNIKGVDIVGFTGKVKNGNIIEFRANVKLAFEVETVE